ncbi:MerR family transcriptional regulator [Planosporangium mesophilum]|uniref:MerR family transcriptional regulator n=1 Tax=Planosporangium mesophilum TaxID=689768 RepID=A0A8J3X2U3_9ACTN|nr:MerR family transcriptional regulator [Planosporangium mesophilum]GII25867.1 MerR family transcriptional regulator [Planosporangium mesophilum]
MADIAPALAGKFDDVHHPAYGMGAAAEMLGVTPSFLRGLGEAGLVTPHRSDGGHRRYSRHQLELAGRARELVDQGMTLAAACRVVRAEDQLEAARRRITQLEDAAATRTVAQPSAGDHAEPDVR